MLSLADSLGIAASATAQTPSQVCLFCYHEGNRPDGGGNGSRYAGAFLTPGDQARFQRRTSSNGTTWTQFGGNRSVTIGLGVSSNADGTLCTSVFDNVTVTP